MSIPHQSCHSCFLSKPSHLWCTLSWSCPLLSLLMKIATSLTLPPPSPPPVFSSVPPSPTRTTLLVSLPPCTPSITENHGRICWPVLYRLDKYAFSAEVENLRISLSSQNGSNWNLITTEEEVRRIFASQNPSKAAGPDTRSPRVLKLCSTQLAYMFSVLINNVFQWSIYSSDLEVVLYHSGA